MRVACSSRVLLRLVLASGLAATAAFALPPIPGDSPEGDQVADPGELERPDVVVEEHANPSFTTTAAVAAYVERSLQVPMEWSAEAPTFVVVRNAGSGYRPSPAEAAYDDLFLVVDRTRVYQFSNGNAEGTEARDFVHKYGYDQHVDPKLGKAVTPALAPGPYRFLVGKHQDKYKALRVHSLEYARTGLGSQRLNGKHGAFEVGDVNVHKGGSTWNWSVGCLTLHYASFEKFIDHFTMGAWGRMYVVGDWDGSYPQRQELADARAGTRAALFDALWAPFEVR